MSVTFSPDDLYIASSSEDMTIKVFCRKTGIEKQVLLGHGDIVKKVIFSPNGKFLATCSADKTIKIWT